MVKWLHGDRMKTLSQNKGLIVVTVLIALVLSAITTVSMLAVSVIEESLLIDGYLNSLPTILDEISVNATEKMAGFQEDYVSRGDIAAILYGLYDDPEQARVEKLKTSIDALDISIVDEAANIVATTRTDESSDLDSAHLKAIVAYEEKLIDFNNLALTDEQRLEEAIGEEVNTIQDGDHFETEDGNVDYDDPSSAIASGIYLPVVYRSRLADGRTLIIEFDNQAYLSVQTEQTSTTSVLKHMLAGLDAYAFVYQADLDQIATYPMNDFAEEDQNRLERDLKEVFARDTYASILPDHDNLGIESDPVIAGLLDSIYLCAIRDMGELVGEAYAGSSIMIAVPIQDFLPGVLYSTIAIGIFLTCGLVFFALYTHRVAAIENVAELGSLKERRKRLRRRTLFGLSIVLVASLVFSTMLTSLESTATTASVTQSKRESLQYDITYHDELSQSTLKENKDRSVRQTNALAKVLSMQPALRTREGLITLSDIVDAEYLMLFDKDGNEICASNTYTGITVGTDGEDPTSVYQSVLHGRPYVVTEPTLDESLGVTSHTVASLVTDFEGLPDGILVMAVDDTFVMNAIQRDSLAGVVSGFATLVDQVAAVVDDETGKILAHSDASLIGQQADEYIDQGIIGRNYEGFSFYNGAYSFVSESTTNNQSVFMFALNALDTFVLVANLIYVWLPIIVAFGLYYLIAPALIAKNPGSLSAAARKKSPLVVFSYGYVTYFCLLALVAGYLSAFKKWPSFGFVFSGQWSKGIHLFSMVSALFFIAITLAIAFVLRAILQKSGETAKPHVKTFVRLAHSLVAYVVAIVLLFGLPSMFGADTATLLASAGIVSIAIGMGSKDLVTDMLAGIFLMFEGAIHVGDIVEIGGYKGRVTDMGIRTCFITDENNDVKIITNSRVSEVVNKSLAKSISSIEIEIERDVEFEEVEGLCAEYIASAKKAIPEIATTLDYAGVVGLTDSTYKVRLVFACNEPDRETLTAKLVTTMQLILENARGRGNDAPEGDESPETKGTSE